ncbi:PREDICTED: olfactory receptor 52A1-like [Elephantulus edwardii]|uniref:olfactory receptor 52A1-like n=1 Tax=Elephantulus edwardii TaxID=28737 RepID=UPI0003F09692|nr:PREDICTED: olfactory receptor 52A1-like [Elephantulus edwardii]
MGFSNLSYLNPKTVTLIGIPGLEHVQFWIGFPFFGVCLLALMGNIFLLIIIPLERSLHQPMYIFLAVLAATDLGLCLAIAPKMLAIFWFDSCSMTFDACLTQLFFIHALQGMESGILLTMAFDRYVAICDPLRHTSILTPLVLVKMVVVVAIRATVLVGILPILLKRLQLFHSVVIVHSYCEHMAVVKLAAEDVHVNKTYGLFVAFAILGFDMMFVFISYILIFQAVFRLPQKEARLKAFNTCTAHIVVFLEFYILAFFSFFSHRFGHVSPYVHILLSTIYLLVPPALNPIVYGVKTKEIRRRVTQIFILKSAPTTDSAFNMS